MKKRTTELVRVGRYVAEVQVELNYDDEIWSPTLSLKDAQKLESARLALESGDIEEAGRLARVFELLPISA